MTNHRMLEIPVSAGKNIADRYGYDQVVIIARRVGDEPDPHGEHVTTYGRDKAHCGVAARVGNYIKHKIMGWPEYTPAQLAPISDEQIIDIAEGFKSQYTHGGYTFDEFDYIGFARAIEAQRAQQREGQ